jgi:hypothetical protein
VYPILKQVKPKLNTAIIILATSMAKPSFLQTATIRLCIWRVASPPLKKDKPPTVMAAPEGILSDKITNVKLYKNNI